MTTMIAESPHILSNSELRYDRSCANAPLNVAFAHDLNAPLELLYQIPGGTLRLQVPTGVPDWMDDAAGAIVGLLELQPNWNSYEARAVDLLQVVAALNVLLEIARPNTPAPAIGPTAGGGVILEWHTNGVDLEIETISNHSLLVSYEDSGSGTEWETEIRSDLSQIHRAIEQLSQSAPRT